MPFEKKGAATEGVTGRTLLSITAAVLFLSLLFGGIAALLFPHEERETAVGNLLESEAVIAFLMLDGAE